MAPPDQSLVSLIQPHLLADTWFCRSCREIVGFLREQPAPDSCPHCRGTRFMPVLQAPRQVALAKLRAA